jgi:hypothetical protein
MRPRIISRRDLLALAGGITAAGWNRLDAFGSEFWDKKPPAEWSSEEIAKLTSKSPWAKPVSAQVAAGNGGRGGMGGGAGGPGMGGPRIGGIPGMGGPRMGGGGMGGGGIGGGRRGGGGGMQQVKGTVRWESAQTILDALKTPLPPAFKDHYVISVSGFPLGGGRRQSDDSDDAGKPSERMLDDLKAYTSLEPKGKPIAQPGVVQPQVTSGPGSILFGFSKEALELSADDKEVLFSTQIGRAIIKTKFEFKEMKYHGKLTV